MRYVFIKKSIHIKMNITKEYLKEKSLEYNSTKKFYEEVCDRNTIWETYGRWFLTKLVEHMEKDGTNRKWTKDLIREESLKYENRSAFRWGSPSAYISALRLDRDFFEEVCSHMKTTKEHTTFWTEEKILKEASKYKQRNSFKKGCPPAYQASMKMGKEFHKRACAHMKYKYIDWTEKSLIKELKKYSYLYDVRMQNPKLLDSAKYRGKEFYQKAIKHLKKDSRRREIPYVNEILVPKLKSFLDKNLESYDLQTEYCVMFNNKRIKMDIVIFINDYDLMIPIEFKHDYTSWKIEKIQKQLNKYNNYVKTIRNATQTYLISPKGKYGLSENEFLDILKHLINKNEIILPEYHF